MSEPNERYCWHCGDRKALASQILCEPCLEEAGDLLGEVVIDHVRSFAALEARATAAEAELATLRQLLVGHEDFKDEALKVAQLEAKLAQVELWLQQVEADKDVFEDPRCLPALGEMLGDTGRDWLDAENVKRETLRRELAAAEAERDEVKVALAQYQRLSNVGRPSQVVDDVDMLNEKYKALVTQ